MNLFGFIIYNLKFQNPINLPHNPSSLHKRHNHLLIMLNLFHIQRAAAAVFEL
jgi:hypothetical protein